MEAKPIIWKTKTGQYTNGKHALVGKIVIGSVDWNGVDRDPKLNYIASFRLPGINSLGKYETEEIAMKKVETAFRTWFNEITTPSTNQ